MGNLFSRICAARGSSGAKTQRGYTLVEVLIALAILGLVAMVFLQAMGASMISSQVNQKEINAERLAKSYMECIKARPYYPIPPSTSAIPYNTDNCVATSSPGYYIANEVQFIYPWDGTITTENNTEMQKIIVKVYKGTDSSGQLLFTLEGYKIK